MSGQGSELLRLLGSGATPVVERAPSRGAARPADGGAFGAMLERARSGEISSGRGVTVARGAGVKLSDEQLMRLARAADRAEAQGATTALVMIDGMNLKLDLTLREVTGQVDLGAGVLTGVDAVISVPAGERPAAAPLPSAGAGLGNASLLKALAGPEKAESRSA